MTEIDYITIKGFKSIASIEKIALAPVNVLIGSNGSGKSNFIGVFPLLRSIREGRLREYVAQAGGAERLLHFGSRVTAEIQFEVSFRKEANRYAITLLKTDTDELAPISEHCYFWDKPRYPSGPYELRLNGDAREAGIGSTTDKLATHVRKSLDSWRLYHFQDTSSSSQMKSTSDVSDNRYLRSDGSNLASYLYLLKERHESAYSLIRRTVQLVAPFLDDFVLEPQRLNPNKIRLEWRHLGSDAYFDAASLSDGTLRFIALATLFLQPQTHRPSVILVDEPELGLHPYAVQVLASLVRQASLKTQVILSTQSALFVDHFDPSEVVVADRVGGGTCLTRLDADKLAAWLEDYSLGQLWEKNEIGGRPTREAVNA